MKILFVQPSAGFLMRGTTYPVCRSIMVTASYMQSLGHEVLVFDRCIDFRDADKVVTAFGPEFAMFYIPPTASIKDAIEVSTVAKNAVRQLYGVRLLLQHFHIRLLMEVMLTL